jgi:co-chaperonin GroES (HSP10)
MEKAEPKGTSLMVHLYKEEETKTKSGIILPSKVQAGKDYSQYRQGVIIAIGEGDRFNDMSEFKVGDNILFSKSGGVPVKLKNEYGEETEYLLIPYEKCVGII